MWKCPKADLRHISDCPVNNTNPSCSDYGGSTGWAVVGHEFLLSTATHGDGRRAFTLMNFDTAFSAVPTVLIPSATTNVRVSLTPSGTISHTDVYRMSCGVDACVHRCFEVADFCLSFCRR